MIEPAKLTWLDLCCGLKGASQPAIDRGWNVITVDIDARFKPTIVADVRALPLKQFHVDVLWASPPCTEFSKFGMRCFYPNPPEPDLSICQAVKGFIAILEPYQWVIENVLPSRPWLTKIFGQVRCSVPGHALWSNQLLMLPPISPHKALSSEGMTSKGVGAIPLKGTKFADYKRKPTYFENGRERIKRPFVDRGPGRYSILQADAAKIPYEIGDAICRAVEAARNGG